jgi:hypothetical protein
MNGARVAIALLLGSGAVACSAPKLCEDALDGAGGLGRDSEQVEDSLLATSANDGKDWKLRATLSGLPELWQGDSAILQGTLAVEVSLAYESDPVGGDGVTEMPAFRVSFGGLATPAWGSNQTSKFPGPAPARFSVPIFDTCAGEEQANCCPYGASECSLPVTLRIERVDGAPYPPVIVDWNAQSSVRVSTCPRGGSAPTLSLTLEQP